MNCLLSVELSVARCSRRRLLLAAAALGVAAGGCSEPKPRPAAPTKVAAPRHRAVDPLAAREPDDGLKVSGDILGSLEQQAIQDGIRGRLAQAASCFQRRLAQQPYLGGQLTLEFRVGTNGRVKRIRATESNLGAFGIERCITKEMRQVVFSRPRGGEAEFTYPLSFEGRVPVQLWDPGMVQEEIKLNREMLLGLKQEVTPKKKKGRTQRRRRGRHRRRAPAAVADSGVQLVAPDGLLLTFYVDRRGQVVSVGLIAASEVDEDFAQRFSAHLKKIKFEGANGYRYAKVTFRW